MMSLSSYPLQVSIPTPPTPPTPPRPATTVGQPAPAAATSQAAPTRPLTDAEIASVRARRAELSNQLNSATDRRNALAEQIQNAEGPSRVGLEQRLAVLDNRIVQLESDIAETGRLLTSPQYVETTQMPTGVFGLSSRQTTSISIVFTLFVLAPIAIAYARSIWKRATRSGTGLPDPTEITRRMTNLEQSIDAIALEIERISEGQRYVTKMFSESRGAPALGAGSAPAEPVRVGHAERVGVPRSEG